MSALPASGEETRHVAGQATSATIPPPSRIAGPVHMRLEQPMSSPSAATLSVPALPHAPSLASPVPTAPAAAQQINVYLAAMFYQQLMAHQQRQMQELAAFSPLNSPRQEEQLTIISIQGSPRKHQHQQHQQQQQPPQQPQVPSPSLRHLQAAAAAYAAALAASSSSSAFPTRAPCLPPVITAAPVPQLHPLNLKIPYRHSHGDLYRCPNPTSFQARLETVVSPSAVLASLSIDGPGHRQVKFAPTHPKQQQQQQQQPPQPQPMPQQGASFLSQGKEGEEDEDEEGSVVPATNKSERSISEEMGRKMGDDDVMEDKENQDPDKASSVAITHSRPSSSSSSAPVPPTTTTDVSGCSTNTATTTSSNSSISSVLACVSPMAVCSKTGFEQCMTNIKNTSSSSNGSISNIGTEKPKQKRERWTQGEHDTFLQGMQMFGRRWTKIHRLLPHKTPSQIRVHAYSYFQKLETPSDSHSLSSGGLVWKGLASYNANTNIENVPPPHRTPPSTLTFAAAATAPPSPAGSAAPVAFTLSSSTSTLPTCIPSPRSHPSSSSSSSSSSFLSSSSSPSSTPIAAMTLCPHDPSMLARSWSVLSENGDDVFEGAGILQSLRRSDQDAWVKEERLYGVREEREEEKGEEEKFSSLKTPTGQKRIREDKGEEKHEYSSYAISSSSCTSPKVEEEDEEDGMGEARADEPTRKVFTCHVTSPRDHQMMDMLAAVVQQQQQQV
ncbi:hypothetical protein VYU27_006554 [Nannochloropsis oceanica]